MWVQGGADFIRIPYLYRIVGISDSFTSTFPCGWAYLLPKLDCGSQPFNQQIIWNRTIVPSPRPLLLSRSRTCLNGKCRFWSCLYRFSVCRFHQISLLPLLALGLSPFWIHACIAGNVSFTSWIDIRYTKIRQLCHSIFIQRQMRKIGFEPTMFTTRDLIYSQAQHHHRCRFPKLTALIIQSTNHYFVFYCPRVQPYYSNMISLSTYPS